MEPKYIRKLNDIIYISLFGKDTTKLLIYFELSPLNLRDTDDNNLRDCMGQLALEALSAIESRCADEFDKLRKVEWSVVVDMTTHVANEIANEFKSIAAGQGIDLLSGQPLTTPTN